MFGQMRSKGSHSSRLFTSAPTTSRGKTPKAPPAVAFTQQEAPALKFLHAFVSLVSLDALKVCDSKNVCEVKKEGGWNTHQYLILHKTILQQILASGRIKDKQLLRLIGNHTQDADMLVKLNTDPKQVLGAVKTLRVNQGFLFPWGTSNHQIYLDIARTSENYRVRIFNLGAGLVSADVATNKALPHELIFNSLEDLTYYLNNLAILNNIQIQGPADKPVINLTINGKPVTMSQDDFYTRFVYNGKRVACSGLCPSEIIQSTGNCVVKNLLFALQQITLYSAGTNAAGIKLYRQLFLEMVQTALELAKQHAPTRVMEFAATSNWLCGQISASQHTFLGVGCEAINAILSQFAKAPKVADTAAAVTQAMQPTPAKQGAFWLNPKQAIPEHILLFRNAMIAYRQQDFTTALCRFGDVLAHPEHFTNREAYIIYHCGMCHYNLGNYERALNCFNDSVARDPSNEDCWVQLQATQNLINSMQGMQTFNSYQDGPSF